MEIGSMTKLMALEYTCIKMEPNMKDIGRMTYSMAKVLKNGATDHHMMENIFKAKSMVTAIISGTMALSTRGIGVKIRLKGKEPILGLMVDYTWATGKLITCTEKASIPGLMEENMTANTRMTKRKDSESILGLTEGSTKVSGKTENSMVKARTKLRKEMSAKVSGKTVSGKSGLTSPSKLINISHAHRPQKEEEKKAPAKPVKPKPEKVSASLYKEPEVKLPPRR